MTNEEVLKPVILYTEMFQVQRSINNAQRKEGDIQTKIHYETKGDKCELDFEMSVIEYGINMELGIHKKLDENELCHTVMGMKVERFVQGEYVIRFLCQDPETKSMIQKLMEEEDE